MHPKTISRIHPISMAFVDANGQSEQTFEIHCEMRKKREWKCFQLERNSEVHNRIDERTDWKRRKIRGKTESGAHATDNCELRLDEKSIALLDCHALSPVRQRKGAWEWCRVRSPFDQGEIACESERDALIGSVRFTEGIMISRERDDQWRSKMAWWP